MPRFRAVHASGPLAADLDRRCVQPPHRGEECTLADPARRHIQGKRSSMAGKNCSMYPSVGGSRPLSSGGQWARPHKGQRHEADRGPHPRAPGARAAAWCRRMTAESRVEHRRRWDERRAERTIESAEPNPILVDEASKLPWEQPSTSQGYRCHPGTSEQQRVVGATGVAPNRGS